MLLFTALALLQTGAAASDSLVTIGHQPVVGEQRVISLEKIREEYAGKGEARVLVERVAHQWTIYALVREERLDGYELGMTYLPGPIPPPDARIPRLMPQLEPVTGTLSGVGIRFTVDQRGQPRALVDAAEVRAALLRAAESARRHTDPQHRHRLDSLTRQARTGTGLRSILLSDIERYHRLLGRSLPLERTLEEHAVLENPFGEGAATATKHIRLDSLTADGSRAFVSWSLTPDADALARIVLQLLEGFAPGAVQLGPEELAARVSVREEARFEIDPRRGVVYVADYERRVEAGEATRREITRLRLHVPEPDS